MLVTYIGHSGFLVETDRLYLMFDCVADFGAQRREFSTGIYPRLKYNKELIVFVSHRHEDHYSRNIWKLARVYHHVSYVISKDVAYQETQGREARQLLRVSANRTYRLRLRDGSMLGIETLRSTDEGVAFFVTEGEHTIYHAGDLNLWVWRDEPKEYNVQMMRSFYRELGHLRGRRVELAFLPLDPRQEEDAFKGMDAYLQAMEIAHVFPMHFWDHYEIINQYKHCRKNEICVEVIHQIRHEGQEFNVSGNAEF